MVDFKSIQFGEISAELESVVNPDLLLNGFLNHKEVTEEAINGLKWLILGYKGSGKSAIAEHLRLKGESDPNTFITLMNLGDFPYGNFNRIVTGDSDPESRFPIAWSWLLLVYLIGSFVKDQGAESAQNPQFCDAVETLRRTGFLPATDVRNLVLASSKTEFKAKLPFVEVRYDLDDGHGDDLKFLHIVNYLKNLSTNFNSESKHTLIIDGLDEILTASKVQYQSLGALITEVSKLNILFHQTNTPAKIVLLCRTELFEKIPGPNKNKIRQGMAIELDWYHDPRKPDDSKLIQLVNLRAKLSDRRINNVLKEYFYPETDWKPTAHFLLDLTRHTPRDFLQLMKNLQPFYESGYFKREQVLSGLRNYSVTYFKPEIYDETDGYIKKDDMEKVFALIGSIRERDFFFNQLIDRLSEHPELRKNVLEKALQVLFDCSAIGNVRQRESTQFYTFKFRNRNSTFNINERIILHRGLWKAMNLI